MDHTGRDCDVSPYTDAYDSIKNVPIVSAGTAWTSNQTGQTYILVFNEGLWMGDQMESTLINQNQLRHFGVDVQDNPYADSPLYIRSEDAGFTLPLPETCILVIPNTVIEPEVQIL